MHCDEMYIASNSKQYLGYDIETVVAFILYESYNIIYYIF